MAGHSALYPRTRGGLFDLCLAVHPKRDSTSAAGPPPPERMAVGVTRCSLGSEPRLLDGAGSSVGTAEPASTGRAVAGAVALRDHRLLWAGGATEFHLCRHWRAVGADQAARVSTPHG